MQKFEQPYRPLLDAGVTFYASLGNHDDQSNRLYKPFNMGGERYYTFVREATSGSSCSTATTSIAKQMAWLDERR